MRAGIVATVLLALNVPAAFAAPDWSAVGKALGRDGVMQGDVYRVGLPRSDLKVRLDGVEIKPALALGSWLAFRPMGEQAMVMGDLVLTQDELNPVMKKLTDAGIEITAVHNHLLRAEPFTLYMHVSGRGDPVKLAALLHEGLALSKTPLVQPASSSSAPPSLDLDQAAVQSALGYSGKANGGVLQFSIPRADPISEGGMDVPEAMGSAIAINMQSAGAGKLAATGDFVLTGDEVNPVIKALRDNGIEVTALHNHMIGEEPRTFFMHFWANDEAGKVVRGLRSALDQVRVAGSAPKKDLPAGCKDILANQPAHTRDEVAKCGQKAE